MKITPFDDYGPVSSITLRLAPIDVGFDLAAEGIPVQVPDDTNVASYALKGERFVVEGTRDEIVRVLRKAGYTIAR
jgi:hypothetical protein